MELEYHNGERIVKKSFLAEHRIIISQIVIIPIIFIFILFTPIVTKLPYLNALLELLGSLLVIIGVLGRVFSSIFMGNNRDKTIVSTGIYSITRNPLYFFSFIATLGITLTYGSIIFIFIFIIIFSLYYYAVIKAEEKYLTIHFKQSYLDYKNVTPRFFPNFKLFKIENEYITTSYKSVLKTIIDSSIMLMIVYIIILLKYITPLKGWLYIW